jgi:signal transduction histidine kinase
VLGWATALRASHSPPQELAQGLETIERNARVQGQIIEDLLDMSRIISGKVRLDVQRLDLPAVLAEAINTVRATASAKGVRLQKIIDPLNAPLQVIRIGSSKCSGISSVTPSSLHRREDAFRSC